MWEKMVFMAYMAITVTGTENDGTRNYLVETLGKRAQKAISISLKEPLPYKEGEYFIARFRGECSAVWSIDDNWQKERSYICNATSLETKKGIFKDVYIQREGKAGR